MKKESIISFFLFAITLLVVVGCKKNELNKDTTTAEDNIIAEDVFNDIFKIVDETAKEYDLNKTAGVSSLGHLYGNSCADILFDSQGSIDDFPIMVSINFGGKNCEGGDGNMRRGVIEATFSGKYREKGTSVIITSKNYYLNDNLVSGSKTITNNGRNQYGNLFYTAHIEGKVTAKDGKEISLTSTRVFTWTEGEDTDFFTWNSDSSAWLGFEGILDDVYIVTGDGNGSNRNGRPYTYSIIKPLKIQFCNWTPSVTEGTVEVRPEDLKTRSVDFGTDNCSREAIVSIGRREYPIQW